MPQIPTQDFLEIDQIKEGIVILKDRSLRAILMVSSLNFALTSDEEQNATIYQYQSFLNSLDFSCQIVAQTRKLNITGYLEKIKEIEEKQENELLKLQTKGYREYIESLVGEGGIMTKNFYVIVPFYRQISQKGGLLKVPQIPKLTEEEFESAKKQLWQRMEFLALGLRRCGLTAMPLTTPELIELFWGLYHPQEAEVGFYPEIPSELSQ